MYLSAPCFEPHILSVICTRHLSIQSGPCSSLSVPYNDMPCMIFTAYGVHDLFFSLLSVLPRTLPWGAHSAGGGFSQVLFSYVSPQQCMHQQCMHHSGLPRAEAGTCPRVKTSLRSPLLSHQHTDELTSLAASGRLYSQSSTR